ncbi:MAG: GNAT family N-acetyltransferase [Candidatus Velthaea sp.]
MQWVLGGGHGPNAPDQFVLHRARDGRLTGVMYVGMQAVLAADDDPAVDAFAVELRRHPHMRSFVGPAHVVERLWEDVKTWHPAPALRRPHQPLYALQRNALRPAADVPVRPATLADAEIVIENSAEMMLGELGYDPRENRLGFAAGVRRAIVLGSWWVWIAGGALRFQCNIGSHTRATAQIQGVWTPPAARKQGFATAAFSAVARRLLETHATLSLYVNDFNADAIALYERLGFVCVGELATLIF